MTLSQSDLLEFLDAIRAAVTRRHTPGSGVPLPGPDRSRSNQTVGAAHYERSDSRVTQRNGHRPARSRPRPGPGAQDPKLRLGSSSPRYWSAGGGSTGLFAVVMEAYVHGLDQEGRRPGGRLGVDSGSPSPR